MEKSYEEIERLKIEGEENVLKLNLQIGEKDSQVVELLKQVKSHEELPNTKSEFNDNDLKDMESKEGGLVDVKKQIGFAANMVKVRSLLSYCV